MWTTRKELDKWAKTRQMGRSRYVWLFWVLGWGLATGAIWSLLMAFEKGWGQWPMFFFLGMIGFPVGGYFLGRTMWRITEKKYLRANPKG